MLPQALPLAFSFLAALPLTKAVSEFANHGTLAGFDGTYIDKGTAGEVTPVTNMFYKGPSSIKFSQTYDPNHKNRFHAEANYSSGYRRDEEKYYGFAFRLQDDWDFDNQQSYNIAQFITDFSDTGCDDASPTTMVWLKGAQLMTRVKSGQLLPGKECAPKDRKWDCSAGADINCQPIDEYKLADNIEGGVWYRLTLHAKWKSDETGEFGAWLNGTQVLDKKGIKTTVLDDNRQFEFRMGMYANAWFDDHKMEGNQPLRQIWIDELGVGSEFKDADPDQLPA